MGTEAVHNAVVQYNDTVCIHDRGDPLRNDKFCRIWDFFGKCLADFCIGCRINGTGTVV